MTRNADFKRRVRERMARTGESYAAARAQLLPRETTLHVTNGDSTVASLGFDALPWRDALHEGPVVKDGRARRAEFLGVDEAEFARRDATLDDARRATMSCGSRPTSTTSSRSSRSCGGCADKPARIRLRQIGEHVGIPHFGGLGELQPEQLRELPEVELTADSIALAVRAWDALTAPEPHGLLEVGSTPELRFMGEAFKRLAQEYPWRRDGLSLSERRLLAGTPGTKYELFGRAWRKETRPFMGDTFAFAALDRLAPLLDDDEGVLRLSERGERVLARRGAVRDRALDRRRPRHGRHALALGRRPRGDHLTERPGGCPVADLPWPSDVQGHAPHARGAARPGDDGERRRVHPRGGARAHVRGPGRRQRQRSRSGHRVGGRRRRLRGVDHVRAGREPAARLGRPLGDGR